MKSKALIESLKPKEIKQLETLLKDPKRKKFKLIYKVLQKPVTDEQKTKKTLFLRLFGKTYSEEKDYLLRNELRVFNEFVKDFIVQAQFEKEKGKDAWTREKLLLEYIKEQKSGELFLREWTASFKRAREASNFKAISDLMVLRTQFTTLNLEVTPSVYNELMELLWENYASAQFHVWGELMGYEICVQGCRKMLQAAAGAYPPAPERFLRMHLPADRWQGLAKINWHKVNVYNPDSDFGTRVFHYQQLIDLKQNEPEEHLRLCQNLASEYFVHGDLEQAFHYNRLAMQVAQTNSLSGSMVHIAIFNYISAAMGVQKFAEATEVFESNKYVLQKEQRIWHNVQRLVSIAYLHLGETEKAFGLMPQNIFERDKGDFYYYRAVYCLGYLIKKDFESAEREADNAYRAIKSNPFDDRSFEKLFLALKHLTAYFSGQNPDEKDRKKKMVIENLDREQITIHHIKGLVNSLLKEKI